MTDLFLEPVSALKNSALPFETKSVALSENQPQYMVSVAPFKGQGIGVNVAMQKLARLTLPKVGEVVANGETRVQWIGHGVWFVFNVDPKKLTNALDGKAAVTDQSDAWSVMILSGEIEPILARLSPFDFPRLQKNQTAYTEFAKLSAILTRTDTGIEIMLRRSAALWAVGQIKQAMQNVSAINEIEN